jgi:general secretion pathway protein G
MFKEAENESLSKQILKNQKGLSLVEILIALTLLALAGTFVVSNVFDSLREGEINSAKIQIQKLGEVLRDYRRKCGRYPTSDQGLDALVVSPGEDACRRYPPNGFIEGGKIPVDPWDNEFFYESDGRKYTLISYGPDGLEGGEGVDADISSEDL